MKILQFRLKSDKSIRIGLITATSADQIIDVSSLYPSAPRLLVDFFNEYPNALEILISISGSNNTASYSLYDVELLAPVIRPDKVLCVGMNYKEHCDELKILYPPEPIVFSKFASAIIGTNDSISKPNISNNVDWEVELVIVISKKGHNIPIEQAYDYILGYTVAQDITARDLCTPQKNGGQFLLGKTFEGFMPLGPWIVTKDEITDPHNLRLKTSINGILKQNGHTSQLIHRIDSLVAHISKYMTLLPGDIISTGTPSGVGFFKQERLNPGDVIETEIEGIGKIINKIV